MRAAGRVLLVVLRPAGREPVGGEPEGDPAGTERREASGSIVAAGRAAPAAGRSAGAGAGERELDERRVRDARSRPRGANGVALRK